MGGRRMQWKGVVCLVVVLGQLVAMATCQSNQQAAQSINSLGFQLVNLYRKYQPHGNVVFSPVSISSAFAMAYGGAKGQTSIELEKLFGFSNLNLHQFIDRNDDGGSGDDAAATHAARVFVNTGLGVKRSYESRIGHGRVATCAFSSDPEGAKDIINGFVYEATEGLIPEVIHDAGAVVSTQMALITAIYFKGKWGHAFTKEYTHQSEFQSGDGRRQWVDYMTTPVEMSLNFKTLRDLQSRAIELPYKGGRFSMIVVLPDHANQWQNLEKNLAGVYSAIQSRNGFSRKQVQVRMPKFDIEFRFEGLKGMMQQLGVTEIFTPRADLSGITDASLQVSQIVHKARIKVDEEGTTAAAVTALVTAKIASKTIDFYMKHPFLYFVIDKNDETILFQGTVTDLG